MHAKLLTTFLVTALAGLAAAHPAPAEASENAATAGHQDTASNPAFSSSDDDVSIMATKRWQASGGCKTDWFENKRCLNQCIGEAESGKCVNWKYMTAVEQGGCVLTWSTCLCVCEY